jgi:hypothetical protein
METVHESGFTAPARSEAAIIARPDRPFGTVLASAGSGLRLPTGNEITTTASNTLAARFAAPLLTQAINCFSLKKSLLISLTNNF